jgi:hypothetical protein
LFGSDQPVRWAHFVYPAICVAAGVGLAEWGRRGRAGAIVAVGLLLALIWLNGAAWVSMISDYLH